MEYARNKDVKIAYEVLGDPARGVPLLMIMGLDFQMNWWPDAFCRQFVDRGFAVVRFDNRDTGLSTHFARGDKYTGQDMVDDALAVMDAVGWRSAHVFGASMGAGLAQALTLLHPERVRTMTSGMGAPVTAGLLSMIRYVRLGTIAKLARLPQAKTREQEIDNIVAVYRAVGSPGYRFPETWAREAAGVSYDRHPRDPLTTQRQTTAMRRLRVPALSTITCPAFVFHGAEDPLVRVAAGHDTARQIPGAAYVAHPGMGHNLPEELWPDIIGRIAALAEKQS
ncbi:alpha/beta fold hydrolase [Hamadaea tsunoensis]|uniref:alpha/beta fold hydrolase n=1 Tax=Hamadaea tsunoensis TaxID=53368 RepID=UPI0004044351|nr:alpha/beta hydrolase [Hamadaea tsunoensis]